MNKVRNDLSFHLPRIWSNNCLKKIGPLFSGDIINVSGWNDNDKDGGRYRDYFSSNSYYISNYVGERGTDDASEITNFEIDLTQPLPPSLLGRFDVVFNHTTLEHIFDVNSAFTNLCLMSKDIVIIIVPFIQETHFTTSYGDFWRFTPIGLREMFRQNCIHVIFEATNSEPFSGNYLFFVGSRYPEKWLNKMPEWKSIGADNPWWIHFQPLTFFQKMIHKIWLWAIVPKQEINPNDKE